ncbi:translation initiation factor IF-2-like [Anguilla anguilla]|uniref:translation initiation factor IF-2-like n=1 Tax=Anguilla anguilla TaxID=7936 RepID=UPI0015AE646C|nr:translation initiation factor IF-2-like [Anguilla anguilla]
MLLVPVEDPDSDSAAPAGAGSPMPLVPGESVVLHPVHGPSGGTPLFRHPSGRLVHLVPLDQLHPAPPDPPASSPDAVAHLPQASPPACESASADTGAPSPSPTTPAPPPCPAETTAAAAAALPAAPKPAPSFLGQRGTQTIRICPGVSGGARSKGPTTPAGFTPLHVPRGTPPRAPRKDAEPPGKGPRSPESGTPEGPGSEPRSPAETDSGGPGPSASDGERRSRGATPGPDETHQLRASAPVRRLAATALVDSAQTAGSAHSGSWVSERGVLVEDASEDSDEDVAGMMSDAELEAEQEADDDVDVETMEELPEEESTAAAQEKLTQAELIRQADSQSELDTNPQAQQLEANGERVSRTESERRRRNQMTDLFTRLQDVLGIESMSKISRVYVLSRALEEIQALADECNRLEAKKRRMTRQREGYIKEIAQSSGTASHLPQPLPPACESASADARADSPSPTAPPPPPCPAETAASARTPERAPRKCAAAAASSEMAGGAQSGSRVSERRVLSDDASEDSEEDGAGETSDAESDVQQETDAVNVETLEELPEKSTTLSMTAGAAQKKQSEAELIRQADSQSELDTNLAARLSHTESERRRRNQMTDLLTRLQDVLGIESVSKISMVYVLSRALEEIQALEDQCCILEERKRSMTRKRAGYIKKIAQRSGKPEELISLKLQDICAKQRSLESKKRKAQQRAPEPDRKQSPPTPASETDTFFLPKIVSVRSLATSPLLTTPAREQDLQAVFESSQTAVSPEGSQSGDLLGDHPPTPSSLQKEGACS